MLDRYDTPTSPDHPVATPPPSRRARLARRRRQRLTARGRAVLTVLGMTLVGMIGLALPTTSHGLSATDGLSSGVAARGDASAATPADPRPAVVTDAATSAADSRAAREAARLARLRQAEAAITWRRSKAVGRPNRGRLVNGVRLPEEGVHYVTWDPALDKVPNRGWRRNGTDKLVRLVLRVAAEYAADHPDAPRLVVGDLSRPNGGEFGRRFGGGGHASHQNGLDVDIYYPRRDRREVAPTHPDQVDRKLAQDLVNRFVRAGAEYVFVGRNVRLSGPKDVVVPWPHHDDHLHVRIRP